MGRRRILAAAVVVAGLLSSPGAGAGPEVYAPEFSCLSSLSSPGFVRGCVRDIPAGHWHMDLNTAFVLEGSYGLRVDIPSGEYVQLWCSHTRELIGPTRDRCTATFAGLADEAGGSMRPVDASVYLHVELPVPGRVVVTGGEGNGVLVARGARV